MKKINKVILIAGISAMLVVGCKEKEQVVESEKIAEVTSSVKVKTSIEKQEENDVNESKDKVEERWTKLWLGQSMEVDLNAMGEFIGGGCKRWK